MNEIKVGARVRANSTRDIGEAFRGRYGIVVEQAGRDFFVDFDFIDKPGNRFANGGSWPERSLTLIESAESREVQRLKAEVGAWEENYASLADDLRGLRADYDRTFSALGRESKILIYALSLLGKTKRAQVRGFTEAL